MERSNIVSLYLGNTYYCITVGIRKAKQSLDYKLLGQKLKHPRGCFAATENSVEDDYSVVIPKHSKITSQAWISVQFH